MAFDLEKPENIHYCWAELMVEELYRQGVRVACLAPGSRSAPLLSAFARHPGMEVIVHFDERALAFYACGRASSSGQTLALVCTSGTAAANFLPGIIEASKKKISLVVITADRPPELQKTGAPQTIEQPGIYGTAVRWQVDIPCPALDIAPSYVLTTVDQAVNRSRGEVKGPVHLNMMFREPLGPQAVQWDRPRYLSPLLSWRLSTAPYTAFSSIEKSLAAAGADDALARLGRIRKGLILVGKLSSGADHEAVLAFAARTGFPVIADISSGLRLGGRHPGVLAHGDLLLATLKTRAFSCIDGVVHFGGRLTSKRCYEWLARAELKEYIMVLDHPLRSDPLHRVTLRAAVRPAIWIQALLKKLPSRGSFPEAMSLHKADVEIKKVLARSLDKGKLSEPAAARAVSRLIPEGEGLFLSNSMPVRDMDMFAVDDGPAAAVGANRGASGIDGITASAAGFGAGLGKRVTLLIGDLAFFYDLNALALLKTARYPLVIIVLNNDGGGIFSFLPIAADTAIFEKCLGTPHGLIAREAAALFGLPYAAPLTLKAFEAAYRRILRTGRSGIIEVRTDRQENVKFHQKMMESLCRSVVI